MSHGTLSCQIFWSFISPGWWNYILINKFSWIILLLMIIILILGSGGNAFIRSLTCKHCRQRELGCLQQNS
jgi:hypothetical protein